MAAVAVQLPMNPAVVNPPQPLSPEQARPAPVAVALQGEDTFDIFANYAEKSLSNTIKVLKAFYYSIAWLRYIPEHFSERSWEVLSFLHDTTKGARDAITIVELGGKISEVRRSVIDLTRAEGAQAQALGVADTVAKTAGLYSVIFDLTAFFRKVFPVSQATFTIMSRCNFAAMVIGPGHGLCKDVYNIATSRFRDESLSPELRAQESKVVVHRMLKVASNVSYVVMGIIGLVAAAMSATVASWVFLLCLTSATSFSVAGYFYEKLAIGTPVALPPIPQVPVQPVQGEVRV